MSEYEYEQREAREFQSRLRDAEKGSLSERKEAQRSFAEALRDPKLIAERIDWMIEGNYGYGAHKASRRIVNAGGRTNKVAQLTVWIAALEWMCPQRLAVAARKSLTPGEKQALDRAVKRVVEDAKGKE